MQRVTPDDLAGRRAVVLGLGRFGGGVGAARFLAERGCDVIVTDRSGPDELRPALEALHDLPRIDYRLGGHDEANARGADLVVANPAVRPDHPMLVAARHAEAVVTTEIALLIERLPAGSPAQPQRVIGVTGTAGKSTTAAMIAHALTALTGDRVRLGGNLGGSLLPELDEIRPEDWIVLELSSFMLHHLRPLRWSPHVAVVTNFAANHLDWHDTLEAYRRDKQTILDHQSDAHDDAAVGGPRVAELFDFRVRRFATLPDGTEGESRPGGGDGGGEPGDMQPGFELDLPGAHNRLNARLAALAVEAAIGAPTRDSLVALADFAGLPHRLQLVVEHGGVRFFNDSKSTTPEAARRAIDCFDPGAVHALLGGYDKGADLVPLARHAARRCAAIYTLGPTGPALAEAARTEAGDAEVIPCESVDDAVAQAVRRARPGQAVLLSPGCASWDAFDHFEQRGEAFTEAAIRWTTETGA